MPIDGILLDLDGTLVDTNGMHVQAWMHALESRGYRVAADRIAVEIGKGGDTLVPSVLGKEADEKDGSALRKSQPEAFTKIAKQNGIRPFAGARELLESFQKKGMRTVLATSSKMEQVELIQELSGLPFLHLIDEIVTADDVQSSKPHPDAMHAAMMKIDLPPGQCVMVGDTIYDVHSARRAGVVSLALLCGGNSATALLNAGARRAFRDPFDLWQRLDDALSVASPSRLRLTVATMDSLMRSALEQADAGMAAGEAPIGCVLCDGDGRIVARGFNEQNKTQIKTAHAEMVTFARAGGKLPKDANDLILVSTLEPCVMCTGAAMESAVDVILYGLRAPADAGSGRVQPPQSPESQMPRIIGDILAGECRKRFEHWLKSHANTPQAAYVKQLLA